ncbi:MAG: flagellar biosynthesis protein FlhB [Hyphomicrobiales bacterium]|nr:flagellar biosynthesis protein FlhB [Hyphomicrobiales bacterium]
MAEQSDKFNKTEEPTAKKISTAIDEGNIAVSREVIAFVSILGIFLAVALVLQSAVSTMHVGLRRFVDQADEMHVASPSDVMALVSTVSQQFVGWFIAFVGILALFGLVGSFVQNSPKIVSKRIKPDFSRISLEKGLKRIFGAQGLFEFFKAIFKFSVMAFVGFLLGTMFYADLVNAMYIDPAALPHLVFELVIFLLSAVALAVAALAVADFAWSRRQWRNNLMMSRQEIKDEIKQSEGDPIVKSRLRSLALDRARRRMIADVPRATMIITNPTHYAVALRYVREEGGAPIVVAKGRDYFALKIREIGESHEIPIYEDKLLARSMYKNVEIDKAIPPEFYKAIAEIYLFIEKRKSSWKQMSGR